MNTGNAELYVLISAYGPDAMEKIASLLHSRHAGVTYLVGWQKYDRSRIPQAIGDRDDFSLVFLDSVGLCNSRNALLQQMVALLKTDVLKKVSTFVLVADDDLEYTSRHLESALEAFNGNADCHILTFRYQSERYPKDYPTFSFKLSRPPKNYFVTSMELGFNLSLIMKEFGNMEGLTFHPAFGVNGSMFGSGEEDILISRLIRRGYKGRYIPADVCVNTESTTSERQHDTPGFIQTKGAVHLYVHPHSWPLRMLAHCWRNRRKIPFRKYFRWWLEGVYKAKKERIFKGY